MMQFMIIKYISCDGLEHKEKIAKVAGCEGELTCYRDADDWFDLDVVKVISITDGWKKN